MKPSQERLGPLDSVVVGPQSSVNDGLTVVLLHGFGAPGTDLVGLVNVLPRSESTRYIFPAAPLQLGPEYGGGRAWWRIDMLALQMAMAQGNFRDLENSEPEGLKEARAALETCLDAIEARYGSGRLVLGGFSQGAMLTSEVALMTNRSLEGVVLFSGNLICKARWQASTAPKRRVVQTHGRSDPVLPFAGAEALHTLLKSQGHSVDFVPFSGMHEIPPPALQTASELLRSLS